MAPNCVPVGHPRLLPHGFVLAVLVAPLGSGCGSSDSSLGRSAVGTPSSDAGTRAIPRSTGGTAGYDASTPNAGGAPGGAATCSSGGSFAWAGTPVPSYADGSVGGTPEADASAENAGGTVATPPSCRDLASNCGPASDESCCASPLVRGGTFFRSYDGVTRSPPLERPLDHLSRAFPATVSDFRLDRFEVTIGRFRKFKAELDGGWRPAAGAGKHTHLNGGEGLSDSSGSTPYERGWDASWTTAVHPADWNVTCNDWGRPIWTDSPGPDETQPMPCANWYEAVAFCIWDGGFLPSEAEWNYAAAGGAEQRVFPWSNPPSAADIDCSYANYGTCLVPPFGSTNNVGSESPKGDGRYGQADLGGNLQEISLDVVIAGLTINLPPYIVPCTDCAYVPASTDALPTQKTHLYRVSRGGGRTANCPSWVAEFLLSSYREVASDFSGGGFRCARPP